MPPADPMWMHPSITNCHEGFRGTSSGLDLLQDASSGSAGLVVKSRVEMLRGWRAPDKSIHAQKTESSGGRLNAGPSAVVAAASKILYPTF